jgi:hypothetical protein
VGRRSPNGGRLRRALHELTDKTIRRGIFTSVPGLCGAILEFLDATNDDSKPFVWTATAESIIAKVNTCRATSSFTVVHDPPTESTSEQVA